MTKSKYLSQKKVHEEKRGIYVITYLLEKTREIIFRKRAKRTKELQ